MWPLAAPAQQAGLPVVGFLNPRSTIKGEKVAAAFRRGLRDSGFQEGQTVTIEYR